MKLVAFLRNSNLGQPKSPTCPQLESAYLQAGASDAASFLSNGTLVFSVVRSRLAPGTAQRTNAILGQACGLSEPVFICSLEHLVQSMAEEPFARFAAETIAERCISFFEPGPPTLKLPLESGRRDCLIFRLDGGEALSVTRSVGGKAGYPTPVLEKALSRPVTTPCSG